MSIVLGILALGAVIALASHTAGKWKKTLTAVAHRYGLQLSEGGLLRKDSVSGAIDNIPVTIDTFSQGSGDSRTTYSRVSMTPVMPVGLGLKKEGAFFGQIFKGEDLEIGDPLFDGRVVVRGPTRAVRALLDRPTRAAVITAVSLGISVEDGAVRWVKSGRASYDALCVAIDTVLELAKLLGRPTDASALAEVVRSDDPAVALAALRAMPAGADRDALDAEIVQTRADALVMGVAHRVGPAAAPGVTAVLENPHNHDALRADALTWLGANTDATALARQHLSRPIIAVAALKILTQANEAVPLETLARLIEGDREAATVALRAARAHGAAAEPLLLEALESDLDDVARAAADSLGLVGTPAAVMPLRARSKAFFVDGALKSAALGAIEAIQGRVGTTAGGLSVVDPSAAGQLSEAET